MSMIRVPVMSIPRHIDVPTETEQTVLASPILGGASGPRGMVILFERGVAHLRQNPLRILRFAWPELAGVMGLGAVPSAMLEHLRNERQKEPPLSPERLQSLAGHKDSWIAPYLEVIAVARLENPPERHRANQSIESLLVTRAPDGAPPREHRVIIGAARTLAAQIAAHRFRLEHLAAGSPAPSNALEHPWLAPFADCAAVREAFPDLVTPGPGRSERSADPFPPAGPSTS